MERSQGEPDTDAVRAELRTWLAEHQTDGGSLEVLRAWSRTLAGRGLAAPAPVQQAQH
jgi:hypothetical protein